jgi:CubicO group peptidase (beta-lactamase class C family)
MNVFALVLTRLAGESLEQLLKRQIADPIGMNPQRWRWGVDVQDRGVAVNGGTGNDDKGIAISAGEAARFGLLFLNKGSWNGRQLISARWVEEATRVQVPAEMQWSHPESGIDRRGSYGFNWSANGLRPDGMRRYSGAPPGMFWAAGHNNNRCFIIPEWNMVIVRLGLDGNPADHVWNDFLASVGEAVKAGAQPRRGRN